MVHQEYPPPHLLDQTYMVVVVVVVLRGVNLFVD